MTACTDDRPKLGLFSNISQYHYQIASKLKGVQFNNSHTTPNIIYNQNCVQISNFSTYKSPLPHLSLYKLTYQEFNQERSKKILPNFQVNQNIVISPKIPSSFNFQYIFTQSQHTNISSTNPVIPFITIINYAISNIMSL